MASKPTGGIIRAVYPSEEPASPEVITYDVSYVNEDGTETVVTGVSSADQQGNVDGRPARKGTTCPIVWIIDQPFFHIHQPVYFDPCPTQPPAP